MKREEIIKVIKKHSKFSSDGEYYYADESEIKDIADELQTREREELIKYEHYLHKLDADKICDLGEIEIIDEYLKL